MKSNIKKRKTKKIFQKKINAIFLVPFHIKIKKSEINMADKVRKSPTSLNGMPLLPVAALFHSWYLLCIYLEENTERITAHSKFVTSIF